MIGEVEQRLDRDLHQTLRLARQVNAALTVAETSSGRASPSYLHDEIYYFGQGPLMACG